MATMTVRMDEKEADLTRKFAAFEGKSVSEFIREAVFERIEDAADLEALEQAIAQDDGTSHSDAEARALMGF